MHNYNDYSMMGPGGPGGVSITGKWISKRTGKTILVRDNIIGEQGMQVILSDGSTISMTEFSRDYIQASDELYNESGQVIENAPQDARELMMDMTPVKPTVTPQYKQEINIIDDIIDTNNLQTESVKTVVNDISKEESNNNRLISKLFNKIDSKPTIDLTISWANFPKQEIKTLIDYLDVEKKDIAEFIYNKYADAESIKYEIFKYLDTMID